MVFLKSAGAESASAINEYTILEPCDLSAAIAAMDNTPKKLYLKNGLYTIPSTIALALSMQGIIELMGESIQGVVLFYSAPQSGDDFNLFDTDGTTLFKNFTVMANFSYSGTSAKVFNFLFPPEGLSIENIVIDGQSNEGIAIYKGEYIRNTQVRRFNTGLLYCSFLNNISVSNSLTGFSYCKNGNNLKGKNIDNLQSVNGVNFSPCDRLSNCESVGVSSFLYGFFGCYQLTNCSHSGGGGYGFVSCYQITNCRARDCLTANYNGNYYMNGCMSLHSDSAKRFINSYAGGTTGLIPSTGESAYGGNYNTSNPAEWR